MSLITTGLTSGSGAVFAQDGAVLEALSRAGFENLRMVSDGDKTVYSVENNTYRLQSEGIAKALETIVSEGGVDENSECKVIFTDMNVPRISMTLAKGADGDVLQNWSASNTGYADEWKMVRSQKMVSSSFGDVDINIYPQLYLKNLILNQIYQYMLELSPAVELTLWPGAKLCAQVIFPVLNDGYDWEYKNIRPGYLTFRQSFRLPFNSYGDVRVGTFDTRSYGFETNVSVPLDRGHWAVSGKFGLVGLGYFRDFSSFAFDPAQGAIPYWSVGADYFWTTFNTAFSLRAEQYMLGEVGVKAEMFRHFRHCSIGLYAVKANVAKFNGGFRFYICLPPYRYKRYAKAPRIDTGMATGMTYNGSNEQQYYYMPVSSPDDTPLSRIRFNSFYVKSFIN